MRKFIRSRNPLVRLALVLPVAGLVMLVIIACGTASDNTGSLNTSGSSSTSASASKHFHVGDQVKVGSTYQVTVNSVKTNGGDSITSPAAGNTFLIVDVSLKNISSQEQTVSSLLQFSLKDSTGQTYTETIVDGFTSPDGKLEAGDVLRGQLAYEVPASMHSFELAFEADVISSGQTLWDLSV